MISNRLAAFLSVALTASSLLGCDEYDPPPEAKLVQPTVGFWTSETPIEEIGRASCRERV